MDIMTIQNLLRYQQIFLKNLIFSQIAFDLRGFGKNSNAGSWYSLKNHIFDLKEKLLEIKKSIQKKKYFYWERVWAER